VTVDLGYTILDVLRHSAMSCESMQFFDIRVA